MRNVPSILSHIVKTVSLHTVRMQQPSIRVEERKISKTRACRVLGLNRSTLTYKQKSKNDQTLIKRMQELAGQHRRRGLISIHGVCKREGLVVNRKRSLRVYREQKLQIRNRPKRKKASMIRVPIAKPSGPNQVWSMDFIHDRLESGRKVKILNVVDDFSRVCVGQIVSDSITGRHLAEFFDLLDKSPVVVRCDNVLTQNARCNFENSTPCRS